MIAGSLAAPGLRGVDAGLQAATNLYRRGDFPAAQRLLLPQARQGNARAQLMLGNIAAQRDGKAEDQSEAARWYVRAALRGLTAAQAKLAACYAAGRGVPQSDVEAVRWYRRAASQGEVQAAASLGYYYQFGQGVPHDDTEAARWYQVAANGGDLASQKILSDFYSRGVGVPRSDTDAALWYRRAADQGDPGSQYALARAYSEGTGVPRDPVSSYYWASIALDRMKERDEAREPALHLLEALAHALTQSEIDDTARRAAEWHPDPGTKENYESPDGTLRVVVIVTGRGGESQVEVRDGGEILLSRTYASPDGQHGFIVQHAAWTADSRFFVFSLASSGGHQPWHYPTFIYLRQRNKIEALEPYTGLIAAPDFHLSAPDTIRVITVGPTEKDAVRKDVSVKLGELTGPGLRH